MILSLLCSSRYLSNGRSFLPWRFFIRRTRRPFLIGDVSLATSQPTGPDLTDHVGHPTEGGLSLGLYPPDADYPSGYTPAALSSLTRLGYSRITASRGP